MATEEIVGKSQIFTISKEEACELIIWLTASLSNYRIPYKTHEVANLNILDKGVVQKRILFCVDTTDK